ncbi:DUF6065 family protein [Streptomyces palmae]|uniref:Uncharacterized protein n=1 Tax=Streptomyces palmae TaxID=1701085 RepID=A0A4Z0HD48_9ACTN|nr:DUF6065 family protein [Streptomyces palmae]TGB10115.1 hypothetical protein E4099_13060 [Streptomyces palmae]
MEPPRTPPGPLEPDELPLIAYAAQDEASAMPIVPAPVQREWIAATHEGFARRCLPLMMANQSEWWLLNNRTFTVEWEGHVHASSLHVRYAEPEGTEFAFSNFGHGVLTFHIPYLFRTPPGWNLLARGPANRPKDGATALSAVVETDWTHAFFTMNWQVTRPFQEIEFRAGEPVCAIVPQRRDEPARFRPEILPLAGSAEEEGYREFATSRERFSEERVVPGTPAYAAKWQRHYLRGESVGGARFPDHRRKLGLRPFSGPTAPDPAPRADAERADPLPPEETGEPE